MNTKIAALTALLSLQLGAAANSFTDAWSGGSTLIPDYANNGLSGLAETITLNNSGIQNITGVEITLDISGGFNGDYYAYLRHDNSTIAVLLNRIGLDASNPYGSSRSGLQVTFADSAAKGDIHGASPVTGPLTGTWQPDGRSTNPFQVSETDPRNSLMNVLEGGSADGSWTLFIADTSEGGLGTLTGWSINLTGTGANNVPEGANTAVLLGGAIGLLALTYRRSRAQKSIMNQHMNDASALRLREGPLLFRL